MTDLGEYVSTLTARPNDLYVSTLTARPNDLYLDHGRVVLHVDGERDEFHVTTTWDHDPLRWVQIRRMLAALGLELLDDEQCIEWLEDGRLRQWISPTWL